MPRPVKSSFNGKGIYRPAHQSARVESAVPTYRYLTPQAGNIGGAWKTSGHFLDFQIPKATVEVLEGQTIRFGIRNNSFSTVTLPPTPMLVETVEVRIGSELVETVYSTDIFNESVGFLSRDQLDAVNEVMTCGLNYNDVDNASATINTNSTRHVYLPFKCCLNSAKLYCKTLEDLVTFRVYTPNGLWGGNDLVLSDVTLIIGESKSATDGATQADAHKSGITYGTVVRQSQRLQVNRSASNDVTVDMTGINGNSAGLVVYASSAVRSASTTQAVSDSLVRHDIDELTLLDQMGSKITEKLDGEWLRAFKWVEQIGNAFPARANNGTYLVSFADAFRHSVENGVHSGERKLTGNEKLTLRFTADGATSLFITNYRYVSLVFFDNKLVRVVRNFD